MELQEPAISPDDVRCAAMVGGEARQGAGVEGGRARKRGAHVREGRMASPTRSATLSRDKEPWPSWIAWRGGCRGRWRLISMVSCFFSRGEPG